MPSDSIAFAADMTDLVHHAGRGASTSIGHAAASGSGYGSAPVTHAIDPPAEATQVHRRPSRPSERQPSTATARSRGARTLQSVGYSRIDT
jgi:hypothetical protein